uniref:Uncharacterized protein n=1 Tax=Amphimedon queenslandica TaxID=400682 RepID=A0A1X7V9J5_AMPQE
MSNSQDGRTFFVTSVMGRDMSCSAQRQQMESPFVREDHLSEERVKIRRIKEQRNLLRGNRGFQFTEFGWH